MAGLQTRCNLPPSDEGELTGEARTKGSDIPSPSPTAFRVPTPVPAQALEAPAPAPGPPGRYTDKDLQKAIKLALELFVKSQEHG